MGHILFGAPSVWHYDLHDELARELMARGHRVTVLAEDPRAFEFYSRQALAVWALRPGRAAAGGAPIEDLAAVDCLLAGRLGRRAQRRATRILARRVQPLRQLLQNDPPDLVLLHQGRSGLHRLIHFAAREAGCRVLHTGEGLLPHTMQWDEEGIDGDSTACRRKALDYRLVAVDHEFLATTTAAWLGRMEPPRVARSTPVTPSLWSQISSCVASLRQGDLLAARLSLASARAAPAEQGPDHAIPPPAPPFVAVLLQPEDCPRIRLDSAPGTRSTDLALATAHAVARLPEHPRVVAILPEAGILGDDRMLLRHHGVILQPARSAPETIATAMAVVTVNHPLGIAALLTATPLVHAGRSPYGIWGISAKAQVDSVEEALTRALDLRTETLRDRFLCGYLVEDHVWCAPTAPDPNGLRGLVAGIEQRLHAPPPYPGPDRASYRAGPVWPLDRV